MTWRTAWRIAAIPAVLVDLWSHCVGGLSGLSRC